MREQPGVAGERRPRRSSRGRAAVRRCAASTSTAFAAETAPRRIGDHELGRSRSPPLDAALHDRGRALGAGCGGRHRTPTPTARCTSTSASCPRAAAKRPDAGVGVDEVTDGCTSLDAVAHGASTSAAAPSTRVWKNERAEMRRRSPPTSSWIAARRRRSATSAGTDAVASAAGGIDADQRAPRWRRRSATSPRRRPGARVSAMTSARSGWATRQASTGTTSWRWAARNPRRSPVDGHPHRRAEAPRRQRRPEARRRRPAGRPVRASASTTMSRFSSRWAAASMCCHAQPPQPAAWNGHGGVVRTGDGSTTVVDDGAGVVAPLGHDRGPHQLAREGAGDEHDPAVAVARQGIASGDQPLRPQLQNSHPARMVRRTGRVRWLTWRGDAIAGLSQGRARGRGIPPGAGLRLPRRSQTRSSGSTCATPTGPSWTS